MLDPHAVAAGDCGAARISQNPMTRAPRIDLEDLMRFIAFGFSLLLLAVSSAQAGDFFPPGYKQFPFKAGDLLVSQRGDGKFAVNKVLKVDRFEVKKGASINIQGKPFVATEDDHLLVVSAAYGADEFDSFEKARAAAIAGKWSVEIGHIPNRAPGAAHGQTRVGHRPVAEAELEGYKQWRRAFDKGEAGVF
jgi:hypothetical protein